ncbi:oocyte-secreted protein 4A [Talpa occidentalis]|uniref:oocyte-secreted protein 4A n=1 Tax=Talpa occidentalis TaxID=50954 RepID=UPI0018909EA9|nr:oocyte-secreted protein 4A [Talpa occidentalis]
MRVSGTLGGLLMLLVLTEGFEDVFITCSEYWLEVRVRRRPYSQYQQPQPHELHLGTGCPVTGRRLDFLEFHYPLSSCGIKTQERPWGLLIESYITYEPVNSAVRGYLPISCYIQKKSVFTFVQKEVKNNNNTSGKHPKNQKKKTKPGHQSKPLGPIQECVLGVIFFLLEHIHFMLPC